MNAYKRLEFTNEDCSVCGCPMLKSGCPACSRRDREKSAAIIVAVCILFAGLLLFGAAAAGCLDSCKESKERHSQVGVMR